MSSDADVPWLIKSSGRILGPFDTNKIADLLKTREISVLDEVALPLRRWQTIQYHEDFRAVIESLRKNSLSEKTEANWTPTGATAGLTQTLTDLSDSELTEELSEDMLGFTRTAKEIVVHDVQETATGPGAAKAGRFQPQQNQNTAIQRQVDKTTRGMWVVTVVILLAVGLFIVQRHLAHGGDNGKMGGSVKQNVLAAIQTGQYADALKVLKVAFPDPTQSGDLAIYYGSLLVQVEGQTVLGRRVLNTVMTNHRPEVKQALTVLGIADLIDGQTDAATENFEKALAMDPQYTPAIVNEAMGALQKSDYQKAKTFANRALQVTPGQGEAMLALAEAQLYLYKTNNDVAELTQVNRRVKEFRLHQWDFAAEVGFYSLYFDYITQDRMLDDKMRDYLDTDPQLTQDHRHSLFIYKGHSAWKILGRLAEQMGEKLGDTVRVSTFLASCYSHEGRWDQARRYVDRAVSQAPKDGLVQAWFSYILKESGDADQASVVLGHAGELNRRGEYVLPMLLQGRFCAINGDNDCARESWRRIYERDLDYLPALNGLAWIYTNKNERGEALKLIEKGLRESPDYIPLLKLRQKAEREGWYVGT